MKLHRAIPIFYYGLCSSILLGQTQAFGLRTERKSDDVTNLFQSSQAKDEIDDEEEFRYIIKFKNDSYDYEKMIEAAISHDDGRRLTSLDGTIELLPKDHVAIMKIYQEEEVRVWEEKDDVDFVEKDSKVYPMAEEVPYGIEKVKAFLVPDTNVYNRKVCIIDTGYDINHPDLPSDPTIVTGYEGGASAGPWDDDRNGHGTHVAGTIAAIGGNNQGVVGVNRNGQLKLHIVRVFGNNGQWAWKSTLVAAVEACVDGGSNIVSMSLGGPVYSGFENEAMTRIYNEDDVLLIAAAGNGGNRRYSYPASYPAVMSVAATNDSNVVASFSQENDQVDISAPGVDVLSTLPNNEYQRYSGTSMATPHVSGVAALVWSHFPEKNAREIRSALEGSAEDLGAPGRDNKYGHGLVRADLAFEFLDNGFTLSPTVAPTPEPPCFDSPSDWVDSNGDSCDWYGTFGFRCTLFGNFYSNGGKTARTACCVCGGGETIPVTTNLPTTSPTTITDLPPPSTPTPTLSPVPFPPSVVVSVSPSPTRCENSPLDWVNSLGNDCDWYNFGWRCQWFGNIFQNDGLSANDVCCVCGGGGGEGVTDPPTSSPTVCVDNPIGWHEDLSTQFTCEWFAQSIFYCRWFGDRVGVDGKTAKEACCTCGGGGGGVV